MAISEGRFRQILREETHRALHEQGDDWQKKMKNPNNATNLGQAQGYPTGWTWYSYNTAYHEPPAYELTRSLPGDNITYYSGQTPIPHWVKDKDGWWYFKGSPDFFNKRIAPDFGLYHSKTKDPSGKVEWRNPDGSRKPDIEGPGPYLIDQNGRLTYIKKGNRWGLDSESLANRLKSSEEWTVKCLTPPPGTPGGAFGADLSKPATPSEFLRNAGDYMSDAYNAVSKKK